jgi:hypothetical protein
MQISVSAITVHDDEDGRGGRACRQVHSCREVKICRQDAHSCRVAEATTR